MGRTVDTRDWKRNLAAERSTRDLERMTESVTELLPGAHSVSVKSLNTFTGTPAELVSDSGPTAGEGPTALITLALEHVKDASSALGFNPASAPSEFVADPVVQSTSTGASIVHLQQYYRGLPVFQMTRSVHFSPARRVTSVIGENTVPPRDIDIAPKITATEAVKVAAEFLATNTGMDDDEEEDEHDHWGQTQTEPEVDVAGYEPQVVLSFGLASQPTVVSAGPFEEMVPAHLVIFDQGSRARLGWKLLLTFPGYTAQYQLVVCADDADTPEVLYSESTIHSARARGRVFTESPGQKDRELVEFPLPSTAYPTSDNVDDPEFPREWVEKDSTLGNNVMARLCQSQNCSNGQTLKGKRQGSVVVFDPEEAEGDDQKALNIFYFCNYMHDFLRTLGFDETAGNFQLRNFSGAGRGGDPVDARSHAGAVFGTANMLTLPEGRPPIMNMGLVESTGRHTAFDAEVVLHEYGHGISNRLVGGAMDDAALRRPQSRGMGEGWSDFFALTVLNFGKPVEKTVIGDWVTGNSGGIRGFPYDSNFPDDYGDVGTGRYFSSPHNIGEIWCATLMEMNRRIGASLKDGARGYRISWQVVVDGLKLTPSNPSFLQARNAILQALDDLVVAGVLTAGEHHGVKTAAWGAFAKFGMGINAFSPNAGVSNIAADFSVPAEFAAIS